MQPNRAVVRAELCGRWDSIVRSLGPNRAVIEAGSCGRWGSIVRSLGINRAVVVKTFLV